jgi:hypothetical protein
MSPTVEMAKVKNIPLIKLKAKININAIRKEFILKSLDRTTEPMINNPMITKNTIDTGLST